MAEVLSDTAARKKPGPKPKASEGAAGPVQQALAPREAVSVDPVLMFERLASDPNVSVEKIERLMALWERAQARVAESAFNEAMSQAQGAMRPVATDAANPQTHSRYASFAALDRKLRPIYTTHGFGLSFDTGEGAPPEYVRVLCHVTHAGGFSRIYHADIPADGKGAKGGDVMTKTHAVGSAMSYGMRYLLKMIFNIAVGEGDDDGNGASLPAKMAVFEALPDALRDSLEKAFAILRFTPGARIAKLTEFLGAEGVVPEEAATRLLEWCRDEFATRKTGQPRAKANGKTSAAAKAQDGSAVTNTEPAIKTAAPKTPVSGRGRVASDAESRVGPSGAARDSAPVIPTKDTEFAF